MKNLIEISKIVTKKKVKKIEIFDDHSLKHKNSKFNEFYEALSANKFKNDRDAASFLYNCSPTNPKYRQLKSRFRKRLFNTLFFLDVNKPAHSNYERAFYSCNKDWTLVNILLANQADHTAASLAKQILTTALKFRFSNLIINCSRMMRDYSAQNSDEKSYLIYDEHIKNYTNIYNAEIRSEEMYQRVFMQKNGSAVPSKELIDTIFEYCNQLISLSEAYDSPVIFYNMFLVWVLRYEAQKDFEGMLEVCAQAEHYIASNPAFYQEGKAIIFHTKKMSAYLHLRDYKKGRTNAEKCLSSFLEGSTFWFTFMEYYLLLALHTDHYIHALAIFNKAINQKNFKNLDAITKEKWVIYEAYLNYISENQGVNNPILLKQKRKAFQVSRFINAPIIYPKDQRIFTLLRLILQILFLLEKKSLSGLDERIERLKNYANRQLKKEEYFRVIQFIRLLQVLRKADYQAADITNAAKYYNKLVEHPFFYRGVISELEVIPYEKLWKMILAYFE